MHRTTLLFTAPCQVDIQAEPLPAGKPGQLLVQTILSAISPGTEMLIYRGQAPANMAADATIAALAGTLSYPCKYGYSLVGRVIDAAGENRQNRAGKLVFAFHPHESHFWADPEALHPLPAGLAPENALFLPNMETAVNFLQDAAPLLGEQVVVFGQGIVGLLTTALLAHTPLARLITLDRHPLRRAFSLDLGAEISLDPANPDIQAQLSEALRPRDPTGKADLVFELSGAPLALQQAIDITGFNGRILIGSWYGRKAVTLDLGGDFHRSRIRLISSQVSSLSPALSGRWTKARRMQIAWDWLARVQPADLITRTLPFARAQQAYALLDEHPEQNLQIFLRYE